MRETLAGRGILVTRPADQAVPIAAMIRARGGEPILFPTIAIVPQIDREPAASIVARLTEFSVAIFVSVNAVEQAFACIRAHGTWPVDLTAVAVGPSTAAALEAAGVRRVELPAERFDSEGMLALPLFASVAGRRFVVFRGVGGREWLGEALQRRGAAVEVAEVYERVLPRTDPAPLLARWRAGGVHAVVVASSESLANLSTIIGREGMALLQVTPTVVPHDRIAAYAKSIGLARVLQSQGGDASIVGALEAFFAKVPSDSSDDERP